MKYKMGKFGTWGCILLSVLFLLACLLVPAQAAEPGDVVLMSPASAAFDQFKNFMVRGQYFKKLVKEL